MRWQQSYLTDIDLIDKIMIFNQGKGTGGSQVNRHKARIESLLYFANLSSSACAICTGSWWSLDVDILGQCYWNDWIQCQLEYLLPPGPSFCGCESCFLVDRVELSMISEDHILTLCFWDRSNELVPGSQSKLNSPLSWNRGRQRYLPCFGENVTGTVLVKKAEFTTDIVSPLSPKISRVIPAPQSKYTSIGRK
jgi:hypothetical protein